MTPKQQRQARIAQANHRGSRSTIKTELENVLLILAWEAEQLSEEQIARAIDTDRVTIRRMRDAAIDKAMRLADALMPSPDFRRHIGGD